MPLWKKIDRAYGGACFRTSFWEMARRFRTTEMAVGRAILALKRRGGACLKIDYADGRSKEMKKRARRRTVKRYRARRRRCSCLH